MTTTQLTALALAVLFTAYTYAGYPLLLWLAGKARQRRTTFSSPTEWPSVSITVPAYNEETEIRDTLDRLLELDYPRDRVQILVVSDASTDRTDELVREYADRGVELLRMPVRSGKTAAENAAQPYLRGEIVVNTDASIRLDRSALKPLIAPFGDPQVGVASGRDVSVTHHASTSNAGEAGYVGYEMWIRELETRVGGIVGASGCCYAIRTHLHRTTLPPGLSRDFASALVARRHGYRSVSVSQAICYVPRTSRLRSEYRRKVRTITRGMETLFHMRTLLDPIRYGWFAVSLWSHKIFRWLVPWVAMATLGVVASQPNAVGVATGVAVAAVAVAAALGVLWPEHATIPAPLALPAFLVVGNLAAMHASLRAARGDRNAAWEPTRRRPVQAS